MRKVEALDERIQRLSRTDANGCWIWQAKLSNAGYARMTLSRDGRSRTVSVHRIAYEVFKGQIPDGMVIDHLCRVRACVNPDHLEVVTQRENIMRSPIAHGAINAAKTHCPRGHEYTPENTRVSVLPNTTMRACKTCIRALVNARRKAARLATANYVVALYLVTGGWR